MAGVIQLKLDDADIEFLKGLGVPTDEDIEEIYARAKAAAQRHIEPSKTEPDWPPHVVSLHLSIHTDAGRRSVTVNDLARSLRIPDGLNVVSEPGTGKSTTLVEIAAAALSQDQAIPVLIPLSDWSSRKEEFFVHACTRHSFRALAPGHFIQLAYQGRLLLLLDGWNELDEASRIAAQNDLKALKRDFPLLAVVVGTRPQVLPIKGPIVGIEPLTRGQQRELAAAVRGTEGKKLVDQAWRTAGIRELITKQFLLRSRKWFAGLNGQQRASRSTIMKPTELSLRCRADLRQRNSSERRFNHPNSWMRLPIRTCWCAGTTTQSCSFSITNFKNGMRRFGLKKSREVREVTRTLCKHSETTS